MAGTFGEPGKNPYRVSGFGGILSNVVNAETGVTQVYKQNALLQFQSVGTFNPKTNTFTPDPAAKLPANEVTALNNNKTQIKNAAIETAKNGGATNPTQLLSSNAAPAPETTGSNSASATSSGSTTTISQETIAAAAEAQSTVERDSTSEKGSDLRYPINNSYQGDYIQIEMRTYKKSGFQTDTDTLTITRMEDREYERLRTIYLPIQSGIVDSVSVDWGNGELNPITAQFANVAQGTLVKAGGGNIGAAAENLAFGLGNVADKLLNQGGDIQKLVTNYFTERAVGTPGLLSRSIGGAINNNLELLFNGPTLRSFTFNFKLTPRAPAEAKVIKDIIRVFKKGMTPQLSTSGLFLSAPNVFKIKYIYTGKGNLTEDHPYLNRIKVAALRDFSVNYTPDGNYMTYGNDGTSDGAKGEGSMTQYDLSMTFGEIDPVYAQDYDVEEGTKGMGW